MHPNRAPKRQAFLRSVRSIALAITLASAAAASAQSIAGTWQGTLPNSDGRIVFKFTSTNDASTQATLTFIDRDPNGIPLLGANFTAPDLRIDIGEISYRGKLSTDGKTITGTWTRNKQPFPLNLTLATPETLWTYAGPAAPPPMTATDPSFEVATIRPSGLQSKDWGYSLRTHVFAARYNTVADLIKFAYQIRDRQIDGGPSWIHDLRFDISAEPDASGLPSPDQHRLMLRKLLAERFNLKLHTAERDFPVYALTIDKNPTKLQPSDSSANGRFSLYVNDQEGTTALHFTFTTMPAFADLLMNQIPDRQIIDETGLTGQFNFTLTVPSSTMHNEKGPDVMDRPTAYFLGVQQLGLKLIPKKAPLEVLVIDNIDKPSAN